MEVNDEFMKILKQDKGYCHVQKGPGSEEQKKAKRLCCEYNKETFKIMILMVEVFLVGKMGIFMKVK